MRRLAERPFLNEEGNTLAVFLLMQVGIAMAREAVGIRKEPRL